MCFLCVFFFSKDKEDVNNQKDNMESTTDNNVMEVSDKCPIQSPQKKIWCVSQETSVKRDSSDIKMDTSSPNCDPAEVWVQSGGSFKKVPVSSETPVVAECSNESAGNHDLDKNEPSDDNECHHSRKHHCSRQMSENAKSIDTSIEISPGDVNIAVSLDSSTIVPPSTAEASTIAEMGAKEGDNPVESELEDGEIESDEDDSNGKASVPEKKASKKCPSLLRHSRGWIKSSDFNKIIASEQNSNSGRSGKFGNKEKVMKEEDNIRVEGNVRVEGKVVKEKDGIRVEGKVVRDEDGKQVEGRVVKEDSIRMEGKVVREEASSSLEPSKMVTSQSMSLNIEAIKRKIDSKKSEHGGKHRKLEESKDNNVAEECNLAVKIVNIPEGATNGDIPPVADLSQNHEVQIKMDNNRILSKSIMSSM